VLSDTTIKGEHSLRVAINNHRTQRSDLDLLIRETMRIGKEAGNAARPSRVGSAGSSGAVIACGGIHASSPSSSQRNPRNKSGEASRASDGTWGPLSRE
jgi:hypothetical protein